ncbi:tetratricopeptide repeat protein [Mycolicibacterium fortuitum]|uniref:tetratricopeptide repeat protein n=1 Tax=Mycolicibacterium fortuitum TaxID=1766 RepID=UPI001130E8BF|nr:tetratricopeptide repeat protein [Mycolicibacterium fortuitum]TPW93636.1 tetratricopeptide repeat protein [Mycolicibacterium fortuitum]
MPRIDDDEEDVFPDEDFTPVSATPPPPSEPRQSNQFRTVIVAVVATIAVLALGWFGWQKYSDSQTRKETAQLAEQVESAMQQYLDTDSNLSQYSVRVLSVDLNKVSETNYEGMAAVNTAQSAKEHLVPIEVRMYGERMMWKAEPGAFLFLAQDSLQTGG